LNSAAILEPAINPIADALVNDRGDAHAARVGERLQPRRDIDAVAINIVAVNDHVAQIDADAKLDGGCARWQDAAGDGVLDSDGAFDGVDDAGEIDERPVANQFHDAAVVRLYRRIEELFSEILQRGKRARLVGCHEA
jgi:hypothetical protein